LTDIGLYRKATWRLANIKFDKIKRGYYYQKSITVINKDISLSISTNGYLASITVNVGYNAQFLISQISS
jgi:hypothetical protein